MSHAARKRRQRRSKGGASRLILVGLSVFFVTISVAAAGGVGYVMNVADGVDLDKLSQVDPGTTSVVYAADGTRLGFLSGPVLRQPVKSKQMSEYVREATVAVEDRRFYEHKGVDVEGVFRAATRNISTGSNTEGASTLEMQLIRNLWTEDDTGSLKRKIREAKLASQLEKRHPGRQGKNWVLTTYLNTAPYGTVDGKDIKGVEAAARAYYNTTAQKLTLAQAAMIAGLPQAPTQYNPYLRPDNALKRRNDVLRRMAEQGYVSTAEAAAAQSEPLGVKKSTYFSAKRESYFLNYVQSELIKKYGRKKVREGGLKIYTTLDLKKQQIARAAMAKHLDPQVGDPAAAVATINPTNGNIEAAASSTKFGEGQYDLALQGKRQPGSTFKSIVLATAFEQGISPSTSYSAPATFTVPPPYCLGTACTLKNFGGGGGGGRQDLKTATLKSTNTVFLQLDIDVGPENVTKTARAMGFTSPLGSHVSEALGAGEASPLEIARVYATIANGGLRVVPRAITKVEFPSGKVRDPQPIRRTRGIPKDVASEVSRILQANMTGGTASAANFDCPAGGKTGTTDGPSDVWLAGFTPKMATAVWVGYPESRRTIHATSRAGANIQGASVSAPIWKDYMAQARGGYCGDFKGLVSFSGSKGTGKYATSASSDDESDDSSGDSESGGDDASYTPDETPQYEEPEGYAADDGATGR